MQAKAKFLHAMICNIINVSQESRMNKGSIGSQFPMILPSIRRSWSLSSELYSTTKLTSCFEFNWTPLIFSDGRRPLEEVVKAEPQEMLHESFIRRDLQIASRRSKFFKSLRTK